MGSQLVLNDLQMSVAQTWTPKEEFDQIKEMYKVSGTVVAIEVHHSFVMRTRQLISNLLSDFLAYLKL